MLQKITTLVRHYRLQLIISLIALPYIIVKALGGGDFRILLAGAEYVRNGTSPYGIWMNYHGKPIDEFLYSPFVAFILIPFTTLPEFIPVLIFCLINLCMLFRIWAIIQNWLDIKSLSGVQQKWWFIVSIAFSLRFILHNFEKTQMNLVVLYLSLEGLYQILFRRKNTGILLLSLGICLKTLPVIFLPYLIYRKQVKVSVAIVLLSCGLLILPAVVYGFNFGVLLLSGWWNAINPFMDKYNGQQNVSVYFHCLSALIPVYFSNCSYNGFSFNIMNLSTGSLFLLINIIRLVFVLSTLYFLRITDKYKGDKTIFLFWELSYIFLVIPLLFPHQQKYSYINLVPAFSYLALYYVRTTQAARNMEKNILLLLLALVLILTSISADIIWGPEIGRLFQFLKLITIGAILMVPLLAWCTPNRLSKSLELS